MDGKGILTAFLAYALAAAGSAAHNLKTPERPNPVVSWSGVYIGVTAGVSGPDRSNIPILDPALAVPSLGSIPIARSNNLATVATGGVRAGYNVEFNSLVLGIEGEAYFANNVNFHNNTYSTGLPASPTVGVFGATRSPLYFAVRARLGYAFDRFLVYATGGPMFGGNSDPTMLVFNRADRQNCPGCVFNATGVTRNALGIVFGVGVEYAITNHWSLSLEYLRTLYGLRKVSYADGNPNGFDSADFPPSIGVKTFNFNGRGMSTNNAQVGLNYKF